MSSDLKESTTLFLSIYSTNNLCVCPSNLSQFGMSILQFGRFITIFLVHINMDTANDNRVTYICGTHFSAFSWA